MIWIGGLVLAVALYLIGPDRFLDACLNLIEQVDAVRIRRRSAAGSRPWHWSWSAPSS